MEPPTTQRSGTGESSSSFARPADVLPDAPANAPAPITITIAGAENAIPSAAQSPRTHAQPESIGLYPNAPPGNAFQPGGMAINLLLENLLTLPT
jgi:hypothetical protein